MYVDSTIIGEACLVLLVEIISSIKDQRIFYKLLTTIVFLSILIVGGATCRILRLLIASFHLFHGCCSEAIEVFLASGKAGKHS
jgi:hypothetical protein